MCNPLKAKNILISETLAMVLTPRFTIGLSMQSRMNATLES